MENIKVSHSELGTITAQTVNKLDKRKKYIIKSLAFLQLVCMTPAEEEDENFDEFLEIVNAATSKARILYNGEEEYDTNSIQQF